MATDYPTGQKVVIRIDVQDDAAPAIASTTQNLKQMGEAGVMTGAKMQAAMQGVTLATSNARKEMEATQLRLKALYNQVQALTPAQMKIFNEQVPIFSKQGMTPLLAQEQALQRTIALTKEAGNAAKSMGAGYGEARIAMGALTGSTRMMEMGLANVGARLKFLQPLWDVALPVALGLGMVGIVVQMGEGAYNLYEKWLDVDGAIEKYNQKASEAMEKQFFQHSGLDQVNADLKSASDQLERLNKVDAQEPGFFDYLETFAVGGFYGVGKLAAISSYLTEAIPGTMSKDDQNKLRKIDLDHQKALGDLRNKAIRDEAALTTDAKARAEYQEKIAEAAQKEAYAKKRAAAEAEIINRGKKPGDQGYQPITPEFGRAEYNEAVASAGAQRDASLRESAKATDAEILRIHRQADEASLTGYQLLEAKRKDADEDFVRAHGQNAQALADIDRRYYAEEKKLADQRSEQAAQRVRQMDEAAQLSGLSGAARIKQEGANRLADFKAEKHPGMNYQQYFSGLHDIAVETQSALANEQKSFADEVDGVTQRTVDRTLQGFARIHAEADAEAKKLQADYVAKGGKREDLDRGIAGVRQGEAGQIADLQRKNAEETESLEAEARSRYLSAEKQQTAAIENEYEQRLRKFQEQLAAQEISQTDYNRRVAAAAQIRDAEMIESSKRAQEQMARQFTSFFRDLNHPLESLKSMGENVAGEAAAALVARIQNRHAAPGMRTASTLTPDSLLTDIFARIAGHPHAPGAPVSTTELAMAGSAGSLLGAVAGAGGKKSIALAQAEIFVQSANIGFGSAGALWSGAPTARPMLASASTGGGAGSFTGFPGAAGSMMGAELGATPAPGAAAAAGYAGAGIGTAATQGITVDSVLGGTKQAIGLGQEATSAFGGNGSTIGKGLDKLGGLFGGGTASGTKNGGMLGGGGFASNVGGAAGGALGLFSAYEGNGGVGGALSGAMSGMKLGMAVGGPIGAAIGAAGGAIMGAIGVGGREKARVYDLRSVRPRLAQDVQSYETGGMNYLSAYADVQALDMEAKKATNRLGPGAQGYYQDTIKPELHQAEAHFGAMEKAGRAHFAATAAQFDIGTDFVPGTGMAVIHQGERIIPSDQNERITRMVEGYEPTRAAVQSNDAWGGDIHIHAIDAKSSIRWLLDNKHNVRAAINASYAENSGGSDAL